MAKNKSHFRNSRITICYILLIRLEYQNIVDNITNKKIDKIINENKEKIILLIDKNILTNWFIHSSYFIKSVTLAAGIISFPSSHIACK